MLGISTLAGDYREIARRRALIRFFVRGQLRASVQRTALGNLWYALPSIVQIAIYYFLITVIFSRGGNYGYSPFLGITMGIMHYTILTNAIGLAVPAIHKNSSLLLQVKIEPLVLVASEFIRGLRLSAVGIALFLACYMVMGPAPSLRLVAYPIVLLGWIWLVWIVAIIGSATSVYARDLERVFALMAQVLMYLSPVVYDVGFFPPHISDLLLINPIATVFALLQWSLLGADAPPTHALVILGATLLIGTGLAHLCFARLRRGFTKVF